MKLDLIHKNVKISQNGCWEWQKSVNSAGYGQLTVGKKYWTAHRYALSCVLNVKADDIVRHKCHNTKCCNPDHLAVGTSKDNYDDSREKHLAAAARARHIWSINGILYKTCREAALLTGLPIATVLKYTKNGLFDVESYRAGCRIANCNPRF